MRRRRGRGHPPVITHSWQKIVSSYAFVFRRKRLTPAQIRPVPKRTSEAGSGTLLTVICSLFSPPFRAPESDYFRRAAENSREQDLKGLPQPCNVQ